MLIALCFNPIGIVTMNNFITFVYIGHCIVNKDTEVVQQLLQLNHCVLHLLREE